MFIRNSILLACLVMAAVLASAAARAETAATPTPVSGISAEELKLRMGPGDPVTGKDKAMLCVGCHGEDGNTTSDPDTPKLAGQYGVYIAKQVRNYLASTRSHMIMSGMATAVSDEDLDDIAAYFASLPKMKSDAPVSNKIGKQLYETDDLSRMMVRCNNCHGATGNGQNPGNPVYPVIGGQHKAYLLGQLKNFKNGVRKNSPGGVMNTTVSRLSDAELEALADYISGL